MAAYALALPQTIESGSCPPIYFPGNWKLPLESTIAFPQTRILCLT